MERRPAQPSSVRAGGRLRRSPCGAPSWRFLGTGRAFREARAQCAASPSAGSPHRHV